ncbi:hypothetical protein F5148DRAFT_1285694 [Russula earlei]|uniref:Uncharacterized protein n=1 Tax=Russula earlei TaxID=71964 RepID=A0ACC0U7K4_9AGAM|nr:hypothetical protein F5148DRAFT_1285694 [Russula earlei]
MAQPQPTIFPPFQDDHSMPSHSSFNPFLNSPIPWHPGSFGNVDRYFPGTSPGQLLGPLSPTDLRGAGKIASSIESDRGSIMNALSAMEREDELCRNYTCCGLNLQDLHALIEHFEESHVLVVDPLSQLSPGQLHPNNYPIPPDARFDSYLEAQPDPLAHQDWMNFVASFDEPQRQPAVASSSPSGPVDDLQNHLRGYPTGSLIPWFSWSLSQSGPDHLKIHHATALFDGSEIGHGEGVSVDAAQALAALRALNYLQDNPQPAPPPHPQKGPVYNIKERMINWERIFNFPVSS